jgi:DNA-binding MurR/RpiR family transcriptional regulator
MTAVMDYQFHNQIKVFAHASKGAKRKLALFLLENAHDAAFMNVGEIATKVGISPGTVSRVAQAMGFSGFPDIQERIREVIRANIAPAVRMERANVTEFDWNRSVELDLENLQNLLRRNSLENLRDAATLMIKASAVYVMGTRSSYSLAYFLAFNLGQIRDNTRLVEVLPGQFVDAIRSLKPKALFIAVGLPRYQRETVFLARKAKEIGCKVLSITDSFFSPLATVSDISLLAPCETLSFFNSYVAGFGLVNGLITQAALYQKGRSAKMLEESNMLHERYETFFNENNPGIL